MRKSAALRYAGLHVLYFAYSWVIVFLKLASFHSVMTKEYALFMACAVVILGAYMVFWQRMIRLVDLSVAYPQKGVVVFWTMIWSALLWGDRISPMNIIGSIAIIVGIAFIANKHE